MDPESIQASVNPRLLKLIAAVIGALFIAGLIVAFTHKAKVVEETEEFTNSSFSREAIVNLSKDGFDPTTLAISSHTRVIWKSSDGETHHVVLNDVNQKDGPATDATNDPQLPNGAEVTATESITHVFEKPGTYKFHDQDNATANVSIIVN